MNKKKVILDSCILYVVYGRHDKPISSYRNARNNIDKLVYLIQKGMVEAYITPQIMSEFIGSRGNKEHKIARFNNFLKKYVKLIDLSEIQQENALELQKLYSSYKHSDLEKGTSSFAFPNSKFGERNFSDSKIMAESTIVGIQILTDNIKDFNNYRVIDYVNTMTGYKNSKMVSSLGNFLSQNFSAKDVNIHFGEGMNPQNQKAGNSNLRQETLLRFIEENTFGEGK